jgi:hypothetical protein
VLYAHVTNQVVDSVGYPPQLVYTEGRWWDLRERKLSDLAQVGWYPVTEAPRPPETATITWDATYTYSAGAVTQAWVQRTRTQEEATLWQENAARDQMLTQLAMGVTAILAARDAAQGDITTAVTLKSQADALSAQISTHISQMQASTPANTVAYMTAMRDAIVAVANRQKLVVDAMSAMYTYRRAVDENAVTTDNALLWLARLASNAIL